MNIKLAVFVILFCAVFAAGFQKLTTTQPTTVCDTTTLTNCATVAAGAVKVDGSAATQPVSGAITQSGTWTVQPGNTPNTTAWLTNADAAKSVTTTMLSAATSTTNGTALAVDGQRVAHVSIACTVTCTGTTITFEGQNDASNFFAIYGIKDNSNTIASTTTGPGVSAEGWTFSVGGLKQIRTRISTYSTGTWTAIGTTHSVGELPPVVNANITTSNNSVNLTQFGGTAADTNSGVKSAGTLRVVLATDQPQLTNKLLVTPDANSAYNLAQVGAGTVATAGTGIQKVAIVDSTGTAITASTDTCDGTAPTVKRYISVGTTDKSQVKATAGALCNIQGRNANASTDAFIKCTNATSAGTTVGSTAVFYDMIVPHAGGYVNAVIHAPFSTALTCYIVTGKADTDATSVAADDVSYFLTYQ